MIFARWFFVTVPIFLLFTVCLISLLSISHSFLEIMLQPDAVYVLKAQEPVYSVTFLNQQLQVGKKNGNIAIYCLSVSCLCFFCVSNKQWPNYFSLLSHFDQIMNWKLARVLFYSFRATQRLVWLKTKPESLEFGISKRADMRWDKKLTPLIWDSLELNIILIRIC